jgi:hypothetical protein
MILFASNLIHENYPHDRVDTSLSNMMIVSNSLVPIAPYLPSDPKTKSPVSLKGTPRNYTSASESPVPALNDTLTAEAR